MVAFKEPELLARAATTTPNRATFRGRLVSWLAPQAEDDAQESSLHLCYTCSIFAYQFMMIRSINIYHQHPPQKMKAIQVSSLTTLLITVTLAQSGQAAALSPVEQVTTVVNWFTGLFDNNAQVVSNPTIPALTMKNCAIAAGGSSEPASQYVHLEQYINGSNLLRTAAYEFSPAAAGVAIRVYGYLDDPQAVGTCDEVTPVLDFSNLEFPSCDLSLVYEPKKFVGTNAPVGCPTSFPVPGSTVVSTVTIQANSTDSFDQFFTPFGTSFGTPIEFRRVALSI